MDNNIFPNCFFRYAISYPVISHLSSAVINIKERKCYYTQLLLLFDDIVWVIKSYFFNIYYCRR